jgi:hypothetical protein
LAGELLPERAVFPAVVGDFTRLFFVLLEEGGLRLGEGGVEDVGLASSLRRKERLSRFDEPMETQRPSTISSLQWNMVGRNS